MMTFIRALLRDRNGNSAIEFALIAPVLAALMVAAADLAHIAFERSDMQGAARAGSQYFMAGGTDLERARTIIEAGWGSMPDTARVVVTRTCECGGTEAACNLLCPDQSVPVSYANIEIQSEINGVFVDFYDTASDKVRVR